MTKLISLALPDLSSTQSWHYRLPAECLSICTLLSLETPDNMFEDTKENPIHSAATGTRRLPFAEFLPSLIHIVTPDALIWRSSGEWTTSVSMSKSALAPVGSRTAHSPVASLAESNLTQSSTGWYRFTGSCNEQKGRETNCRHMKAKEEDL